MNRSERGSHEPGRSGSRHWRDDLRRVAFILPVLMIGLAVFGAVSVGLAAFGFARAGLEEAGHTQLGILADSRSRAFDVAMQRSISDISVLASGSATRQALTDLTQMINALPEAIPGIREEFRVGAPEDEREAVVLDDLESLYAYAYRNAGFHPGFLSSLKNNGYGEIYLVNADGLIVYTVTKSADFLASLDDVTGSGLADVIEQARAADAGTTLVSDIKPYALNGDEPALFIARQVPGADAAAGPIGTVVVRLDGTFFDALLSDREGLGETGETFLIDEHGTVLTNMPLAAAPTALSMTVDNEDLASAATREGGTETVRVTEDGVRNVSVARPVRLGGKSWAVFAEKSEAEVMTAVTSISFAMAVAMIVVLALAAVFGVIFSRRLTDPLSRLNRTMRALADGDLSAEIDGLARRDELGDMARTVEVFRENAVKVRDMTEEEAARLDRTRAERAGMMQELQRAFGEVVDAAIAGDFTRRVEMEFPDAELNALARSINTLVDTVERGLDETGGVLAALAQTDLTLRVNGDFEGAFAKLKTDTNAVADRLVEIVGQIRETSRGLKTATGEILSGANDLSERTTRQAATIEETSAAMEQLAHTVMENADQAGNASDQAKSASVIAERGGGVMAEANKAMERISTSSTKISNIIGMIDDIAFQTNLLALNASVEAARAGEAGKGFAVVAVEVRRLAQSAAQASAEVKALIEQSASEVSGGSKLVAEAARELAEILEAVRANAGQMEHIARQSREQASAIEEVNVAVRQMDEMTQHNAALVEETNAAIEQTEAQASDLDRIVAVFTLDDATVRKPAATGRYAVSGNAAIDPEWTKL